MEFKTLFDVLKKHMSDGHDIPYFFRDLMAMITTMTEEEWGTSKDPSRKLSDSTIKSYVRRGLPKKLARTIVYRLTPDILMDRINELNDTKRDLMARDLIGYDPTINKDNVADIVAGWMVDIFQNAAGIIQQTELQKRQQAQLAAELKMKYGAYLFEEVDGFCPFPGCGRKLSVSNNGETAQIYDVILIDRQKKPEPSNLLAMCPQCCATYRIDDNKKLRKDLREIKRVLSTHRHSVQLLDELPLEKGIIGVIRKIKNLGEKELEESSLDPKEIKQKLDPAHDITLYHVVNNYVTVYYIKIREIMKNQDKRGEIDYEEIQSQMHAIFVRLKKIKKSNLEIFNEIAGKVHRITLQEDIYCQIVVSYFIQSCEVFDAIAE